MATERRTMRRKLGVGIKNGHINEQGNEARATWYRLHFCQRKTDNV